MKKPLNDIADNKRRNELENNTDLYYSFLLIAVDKIIERKSSTESLERRLEGIIKEQEFIYKLLHSDLPLKQHEFIIEFVQKNNMLETLKIKNIKLPKFYSNEKIRSANRFFQYDLEFEHWKNSGFIKTFGFELAQCKALEKYQTGLKKKINDFKSVALKKENESLSFNWIGNEKQIKKLYKSMIDVNYIECSDAEFTRGFSGVPVTFSPIIKWKILTKNKKHISKVSLFYFLEQLEKKKLISRPEDLYGSMRKIFFQGNNNPLENLKQSFGSAAKCAEQKTIDDIIETLSKI